MRFIKSTLAAGTALALAPFALAPSSALAERGADGELKIIYWQAASTLNPYLSGGTKDVHAASLIIEPLARFDENGALVPYLVTEIPSVSNGGISEDFTSITWNIRDDIVWSDGSKFTSADVKFTFDYCTHPEGGCAQASKFESIESIDTPDESTVVINFKEATPYPFTAFSGAESPVIQKAQFEECMGAKASTCTDQNFGPIGTGAFKVVEFKTNDVTKLVANEAYRDAAKPAFGSITLKGGGSADASARSVLQTGEFDYAWNLQLAPEVIANMEKGGKGTFVAAFGSLVERLMVNFTDPSPSLGDERSTRKHPHPFLSDIAVRQALSMAIDRELLVEVGYGKAGQVTCNVIPAPAVFASTANDACKTQDIDGANKLLDEAGWVRGSDGVRAKDGVRLSILYQTSTNAVRQDFQALIKDFWSEIGVETELRNLSASVFFGGDASSPDTYQKFFADIEMYANLFPGTDPQAYLGNWMCDKEPRPSTQWQGENMPRFCDPKYDEMWRELSRTADIAKRGEIGKAMNDILMQNYVMIPLVHRGDTAGVSNTLGGVKLNVFDSQLWNVADWHRIK